MHSIRHISGNLYSYRRYIKPNSTMITKVNLKDGLIGDFLGSIPAVQELARRTDVRISNVIPAELYPFFNASGLEPLKAFEDVLGWREVNLNCTLAWEVAIERNLHMTQAYFHLLGLPVPETPVKAQLTFPTKAGAIGYKSFDYIIAPFSRSLPGTQRVNTEVWKELIESLKKDVLIIGHTRDLDAALDILGGYVSHDQYGAAYINSAKGSALLGGEFTDVIELMKIAKGGLISVVSGPSHVAFHVGIKNYLITNQRELWGNNPDAVQIRESIPELTAETIMSYL